MLRKTVLALLAIASIVLISSTVASARGGGGGGHGGGFGGGAFHGGGFHGRGFEPGLAFGAIGTGLGYGLHRPYDNGNYGYYGYPYVYYPNGYTNSYDDNEDCYEVQRRVQTTHGWRLRAVQVWG